MPSADCKQSPGSQRRCEMEVLGLFQAGII